MSFALDRSTDGSDLYDIFSLETSGTVTDVASGGTTVMVSTPMVLSRMRRTDGFSDDDRISPFVGALSLSSEDGDTLTVSARDTDTAELRIDLDHVAADGTVRTRENVPFAAPDTVSPNAAGAN